MTEVFKKSFLILYNLFLFCAKYIIINVYTDMRIEVSMFSKENIIEILNSEDLFIDNFILDAFIKNWKIEPIYEDAQGVEFFDEMAVEKIRNGIKQKQPKCEINIMDKDEIKPVEMSVEVSENIVEEPQNQEISQENEQEDPCPNPETEHKAAYAEVSELPVAILDEVNKEVENELKNVTLDISNQTLAVLAESIARKITYDVADFIKKTDFIEDAVQLGEYKKDNQILLQKVEEIISDNKILIKRIEELEKENRSFVKLFGSIYVKNQ